MKMPNGSLCQLIVSKFHVSPKSDEFYTVFAHTMSYLTCGISYSEFQSRLKPLCKGRSFSAKDFRLLLHRTEYLSLVIRLYSYRLGKTRSADSTDARSYATQYGMFQCDARLIFKFWCEQQRFRSRIKRQVRELDVDTHLDLDVLRETLQVVMKPLDKYIKSFTYRKLRFICKSQNLDLIDMQNELVIRTVNAFHKMMPCTKGPEHAVNYLKRTVHNAGINFISANTSLKAGRLVNNDPTKEKRDSFSLLVVSENQMRPLGTDDQVSYEEMAGHNPIERVEIEHSVGSIVSQVRKGSKKHKFLTILMGVYDQQFTDWLRAKRYCTLKETNCEYQDRVDAPKFNILVGRFLKIDSTRVESYIARLRTSLDPEERGSTGPLQQAA